MQTPIEEHKESGLNGFDSAIIGDWHRNLDIIEMFLPDDRESS